METIRICTACREPLPASTAEGLCPKCLLQQAIATQTVLSSHLGGDPAGSDSAGAPRNNSPCIGELFGSYRILRLLGRGGMGEVYEADHVETGRRVALKVVSRSLASPEEHARFLREGRLAASISHPHTVYIYGSEEIQGSPVIAMELVGGGTLKDQVKERGPLPIREAVDAILQVISGLDAAHAAGILHRDIKPANCFVDTDRTVKVGDFGLSISTLARGETFLTAPGSILGTPAFASPEQLRGEELDVTSDIYSVGATLYFLTTGRAPLEAPDLVRLITEVLDRRPEPPENHRPQIPRGLSRVILRTLEKGRGKRFTSYLQLREALLPFSSTAPTAATMGLRFIAGVLDYMIGVLPEWICVILNGADSITSLGASPSYGAGAVVAVSVLWTLLYFGLSEGLWGAALGKSLFGLRVVGPDGHTPTIPRALARTAIFLFVPLSPYIVQAFVTSATELQAAVISGESRWADALSLLLLALLFVTVRRRNGFAGLHELLTQTRVLQRPSASWVAKLAKTAVSTAPVIDPAATTNLGPYQLRRFLGTLEQGELWSGYDPMLRREVWLHKVSAETPSVSAVRRKVSRAGRLRWLNGRRSSTENWDAYQAPSGAPLLQYAQQPWHILRKWLRDLAAELYTGARTQSAVATVGLNSVWITDEGQAILLDFAIPVTETATRPARPGVTAVSYSFAAGRELDVIQSLLGEVTAAVLDSKVPPPWHAIPFLRQLREGKFPAAELLMGNLESLGTRTAVVSPGRRLGAFLAWPVLLAAMVGFGLAYDYVAQKRWDRFWGQAYPNQPSLRIVLQTYQSLQDAEDTDENLEPLTDLYEVYLAHRFREVIADPDFWSRPQAASIFTERLRQLAERAVTRASRSSPDQVQAANNLVTPILQHPEIADFWWYGLSIYGGLLALTGLLTLGMSLLAGVHPVVKLFGLVVVRRDGTPAGRLSLLWRSLLAWLPIFAVTLCFLAAKTSALLDLPQGWNEMVLRPDWPFLVGIGIIFVTGVVGMLSAWISPARGLHDYAAGTFVVPK